ncbi:MAG: HD domain-containing phosphohydrolase [Xanthomonadaceae bacterium]|nr:HD domain-containing phosphohydrolase [Xanthomonadaceae bacterium]MDP2186457.1 HD domain-containing phosphohydrolase [Xanthomonadales bacterium]MDZ4115151.1 HD domain-containing phosphohydrolase [Xanthomonadaceae bacterium]MDZ4377797.1 HD domain-containing phosphohydrolase [Xanthomonadaceae bacterium]
MDSDIRNDAEHASILADEPLSAAPVAVGFERKVRRQAWWIATKVAGLYAVCGMVWIVLSDRLLGRLGATVSADLLQYGTLKGLAFVLVTAAVLLLGLHRALLRWHRFEINARASAALMWTVAATLPDALVVLGADGRIRFANRQARTLLGISRSALIGNAFDAPEWAITDVDGAAMDPDRLPFARVRAQMQPVMDMVHAIHPVGSTRKLLSVNAAPLLAADGGFAGMVASIRDITQTRREQIIDERSSSVLRALSDFDAFVLEPRTAHEILEYACRSLTERGVCMMSWIGYVQADTERSVTPMASSGGGRIYLDTLRVSWDNSDTGAGPVGRAVRSRKLVVVDDIANDPGFAHWRQFALEHGFSCAFAAPVIGRTDVPDFVLCGYHREACAYAEPVQELIAEFSHRLGYALEMTRRRAESDLGAQRIAAALRFTIIALQRMVEARDPYTFGHEERVARLAVAIADVLGFPPAQRQALDIAAQLHDIGKMSVPAEILSKPTRLTAAEYELIKGHVESGYRILEHIDFGMPVADIMRQHHERLDGSGYPNGLHGEQIRFEARVLAVADVAESMLSHRPYRASLGLDAVRKELLAGSGTHYDADAVDACIQVLTGPLSPL